MDIRCPVCSEPWDLDELHDVDGMTFDEARRTFYSDGCGLLFNGKACKAASKEDAERAAVSSMLADLLGDDIDGIACMEEDFDMMYS
jgi:hypothetical protein